MRFSRIIGLIVICCSMHTVMFAQPMGASTRAQMLEVAQEQEAVGDYVNAIDWYSQAYDEERDKDLAIKVAELNYFIRDYKKAESWFKRVLARDKNLEFVDTRFTYARMLKDMGRYNDAIAEFSTFMDQSADETLLAEAKRELVGIQLLNDMEPNIDVVVVGAGDVNTPSGEYSPREAMDGSLYYGSFNRKKEIVMDGGDGDFHAKIYMANLGDEGFDKGTALGEHINRKDFHNSNLTFSRDGRTMYFTRTQMEDMEILTSEIYYANKKDTDWSPAEVVNGISGEYFVTQPAMGELFGNEVMFFVSDMDGGYGGNDIYYATKTGDGTFSSPVNLGETINTAYDEESPFYQDGTIYFSSNGHPSIGGFDIYKTSWNGSEWSGPTHMGGNYNSAFDDNYFSLAADGRRGYFVSNRPYKEKKKLRGDACCGDIFMFATRDIVVDLMAMINDEDGPLNGAELTLINETDSVGFPTATKSAPLGNSIQFLLEQDHEYIAVADKEGYYPDTVAFNTAGLMDDYTVKKNFVLKKEPPKVVVTETDPNAGQNTGPIMTTETVTINQAIRLNNIYYDFDDSKILEDAEQDLYLLEELMNKYPDMVIELSSHTDAQGVSTYNQALSQRRAQSAVDWLIQRGIPSDRMKAVGYGESTILNRCVNGVRCSDDEHRINRRTEFKIIAGPQTIEITREVPRAAPHNGGKQFFGTTPIITILNDNQDLGVLKKGEAVEFEFLFTNTGSSDLKIDLITGCKCSVADWPQAPIAPGENGSFKVYFDSSDQKLGKLNKILDIISNTEPIVVEARFEVTIEE